MKQIAYCGLVCEECELFLATKTNDAALREKLSAEYSSEHCQFTPEDMYCDGCPSSSSDSSKMCADCGMRTCAREKQVETCGHCPEYPCRLLNECVPMGSDNRLRLDAIFHKLRAAQ